MKNFKIVLKNLFVFFAITYAISSCGDGDYKVRDFINYDVEIMVSDEAGGDLLSGQTENNILDDGVQVIWNGKTYDLNGSIEGTRALRPDWKGLRIEKNSNGRYAMLFGEFDTGVGFHDEEFVINWGDGTSDTVSFSLYVEWDSNNEPIIIHRAIRLNGRTVSEENLVLEIIK